MFTVITAPVVAQRVGQLAYREQDLQDNLAVDESRTISQADNLDADDYRLD